jgi:hypothetical protein
MQQEAASIHSTTCHLSPSLSTARYASPFPIIVAIAFSLQIFVVLDF